MSGAVGSIPSFTRSGRRSRSAAASLRSSPSAGSASTALRASQAAVSAGVRASRLTGGRMLDCAARRGPRRPARRAPSLRHIPAPPLPRRMTDAHGHTMTPTRQRARLPHLPYLPRRRRDPARPRIKKLRVFSIFAGLALLAFISTVFGMMMAVASDLPQLENRQQYASGKNNSVLLDYRGRKLGILTNNQNVVLVSADEIAPAMKHATIAIEDKRFYTNPGFDIKGIVRAVLADVGAGRNAQGASTITQQFVKVALEAQGK